MNEKLVVVLLLVTVVLSITSVFIVSNIDTGILSENFANPIPHGDPDDSVQLSFNIARPSVGGSG